VFKKNLDLFPVPIIEFEKVLNEQGGIVDLRFVSANPPAEDIFSSPEEELKKQNLLDVYPHLDGTEHFRRLIKSVEDGSALEVTMNADVESPFSGRVLRYSVGPTERGCLMMMQDITALVTERDTARGQLNMMVAACDDAVNGIAIADDDHRLVYANPALCKILGYTNEELLNLSIGDLMHQHESDVRYELAEKLISEEIDQYVTDRTYLTKTGEEILFSVAVSTMHDVQGNHLSLAHFRDVRAERKAQHALRSALVKAKEATRMKSEFLANMSHEIRTPLNGVIGMAQVLSYSDLSPEQAEHLAIIRESSTNLMSLLNDILDLSKVEAGKIEIAPVETDLRHKLNRLFKLHEPIAKDKGLDFDLVIHPTVPSRLKLDPVRLRQCVSNLISNAIKFTQVGRIVVAVTSKPVGEDHEVTVHVSDTGIGITPDKLNHVFDSFQQADGSTTRNFGGTGLGLTISRKLAELMGGGLSVVSEEGRGSVFTLRVMAQAVTKGSEVTETQGQGREDHFEQTQFNKRSVLVVDDNLINRRVACTFLRAYGFQTIEASDGVEAVEKATAENVDLILMDVHMPRLDGVNAAQRIRQESALNASVPIIALTADAMSGDREKYLGMGMSGYIAKPINEREFIAEIGQALSLKDKLVANY